MKKIVFSLFAALMVSGSICANTNLVSDNVAIHGLQKECCKKDKEKFTPQSATDKLVSELGLNKKQAKKLLRLNQEYAELIANPRFKGKPKPADLSKTIQVDAQTGASQQTSKGGDKHHGDMSPEDKKAHIQHQREKRNSYNAALKQILTESQYNKYLGK